MSNPYTTQSPNDDQPDRVQLVIFLDGHPDDVIRVLRSVEFISTVKMEKGAQVSLTPTRAVLSGRESSPVTVEFEWSADGERTLGEYARAVAEESTALKRTDPPSSLDALDAMMAETYEEGRYGSFRPHSRYTIRSVAPDGYDPVDRTRERTSK